MSKIKQGDRVGAFLGSDADKKVIQILGYGVYEGHEVPPDTGPKSLTRWLTELGKTNPKIKLDNGDIVWGCECWWGPEDEIRKQVEGWQNAGYAVEEVKIDDYRN